MHSQRLDSFRGISALIVLVGHISYVWQAPAAIADAAAILSRHAVLVFFLLSGHLITQSILANAARGGFSWRAYAEARLARIYPPFIGAVAVTVLLCVLVQIFELPVGRLTFTARDFLLAALTLNGFLDANGPLWTLYMELHLYAIAMLVALRRWWIVLAVVLFALFTRMTPDFAFFALVWGLGALSTRYRVPLWIPVIALVTLLVLDPGAIRVEPRWQSYAVQCLACFLWMRWMLAPGRAPLAWTADFSYSLYVIHLPMLLFAYAVAQHWLSAIIAVPLVVGAAILFAKVFEAQRHFRPFIHRALAFQRLTDPSDTC